MTLKRLLQCSRIMEIKPITSQSTWTQFFDKVGSPSFLQSWEWGEFQIESGHKIVRLELKNKDTLVGIALVEKIRVKRGDFLFIPHGPLIIQNSKLRVQNVIKKLRDYLIDIAKKEHFDFIRIGSSLENNSKNEAFFKKLGFHTSPIYIHSENAWVLPLTSEVRKEHKTSKTSEVLPRSDDELLAGMRKTTRYLIRKAAKEGVVIEKREDIKALDDFFGVYRKTVEREKFSAYPDEYIINEFKSFHKTGNALVLIGKYQEKVLAGALILFTRSAAFYHQGASIHTKVPVPYLLQWEAIKEAKKRGCSFYNFWGTLIPGRTPKNWEGLTTFKTGFGGFEKQYVSTQDYAISPKYYLTYLYEKFLGWKRGV